MFTCALCSVARSLPLTYAPPLPLLASPLFFFILTLSPSCALSLLSLAHLLPHTAIAAPTFFSLFSSSVAARHSQKLPCLQQVSMGKEEERWLGALLSETYFGACDIHSTIRKNERNVFCAHCQVAICQHCLPSHRSHSLFQIRRYVYNDVIRLDDIQQVVDCEHVQAYIVNSAKVVFLNQRPQSRPAKGVGNACRTCDRILQDGFRFCSLACRVEASPKKGGKNGKGITFQPSSRNNEIAQLSPDSVIPDATSSSLSPSSSVSTANDTAIVIPHHTLECMHKSSKLSSTNLAAAQSIGSFNKAHFTLHNPTKLKCNTVNSSHSSKSLKHASKPTTLKWARTLRWPSMSKSVKRLPFSPYIKQSFTSKVLGDQISHKIKAPYLPEESISCYVNPFGNAKPLGTLVACFEDSECGPLTKRRKGTPHRSPIC